MHIHQIPVKDHQTLKTLADEIRIFEEILHPNLVLFYGVEIYRVSLLSALSFYRATLRKACKRVTAFVSVRLSVCLSAPSRKCIETTVQMELVFGLYASFRLSHTVNKVKVAHTRSPSVGSRS